MRALKWVFLYYLIFAVNTEALMSVRNKTVLPVFDIYEKSGSANRYPDYRINPANKLYKVGINEEIHLVIWEPGQNKTGDASNFIDSITFMLIMPNKICQNAVALQCRSFQQYPFVISNIFKEQLSSVKINDLEKFRLYTIIKWRTNNSCSELLSDTDDIRDTLIAGIGKFGFNLVFDFSAFSKEYNAFNGEFSSFLIGFAKNLSYTDMSIVYVDKKRTAMPLISAPVLTLNYRNQVLNNIGADIFLVPDNEDITKAIGYGAGISLLGDPKLLRFGWIRYPVNEKHKDSWVVGINISGIFRTNWSNFFGYAMPKIERQKAMQ